MTIQPPGNIVRSGEQQDERRQRADSKWVSGEQQIMWNIKYVNISFEVWGGILSFIIMFCTMLRGNVRAVSYTHLYGVKLVFFVLHNIYKKEKLWKKGGI